MTTMIGFNNLNTGTITQYSVKASSPYTVLGISPTLAIFAVLVLSRSLDISLRTKDNPRQKRQSDADAEDN